MSTTYSDLVKQHGSYRKAAKAFNMKRTTFFDRWKREKASESFSQKQQNVKRKPVSKKKVTRFIFSCAVRGAPVHADFLRNLDVYADYIGAQILIGPLTNNARQRFAEVDPIEFDPELHAFLTDAPLIIGDKVRFSPEVNLTATASKPLSGMQTYTKRYWGVFAHPKVALDSVATHKHFPTKLNVTTGAVTHAHYSPTKSGFRAKFDHVYGAVLVEVSDKGAWMRHLTPTSETDGSFYDLDRYVTKGAVKTHKGVAAVVYGDIHAEQLDPQCAKATWGYSPGYPPFDNNLVELLRPGVHVIHDLMDMSSINHHDMRNMMRRYERYCSSTIEDDLGNGMYHARWFLEHLRLVGQPNAKIVVVDSNHDHFLDRWLNDFNPEVTGDLKNAAIFYELKAAMLRQIENGGKKSAMEKALRMFTTRDNSKIYDSIKFLRPDEPFEVCRVELGWHGHRGANGSRGSRGSFKFVTEKATTGHLHSAFIESGHHIVGTSSCLDLKYNEGPSSWTHTHGIIYPNGMRTLITMSDGKFWADQKCELIETK